MDNEDSVVIPEIPVAEPIIDGVIPEEEEDAEIRDTDIVFDCPHCGHNLVIDYQGAGMVITCVECHNPVQVPIPDGMRLSDLDQPEENLQKQISTLRTSLQASEARQKQLEEQIESLKESRLAMQKQRAGQMHRLAEIRGACEHIQRVLTESSSILNRIFDMIQAEIHQ